MAAMATATLVVTGIETAIEAVPVMVMMTTSTVAVLAIATAIAAAMVENTAAAVTKTTVGTAMTGHRQQSAT
jgi:hypothetical protein